ncbi:MAG: NAD(P)H-binding protein, partial [bacterium]|nr:NAD(P)H-binding protein [bacterium]
MVRHEARTAAAPGKATLAGGSPGRALGNGAGTGMRVGVIGATGYVGGRLVPELLAAGHQVRCLARTPSRLDRVPWRSRVDVVTADVFDAPTLESGFHALDAVYYLVHSMGHARDFEQADR